MKAYWHDNLPGDRRQPHVTPRSVSASDLEGLGISYYHLPELSQVDELAYGRGYVHRDEITVSPEALGGQDAFDARLKVFFNEHLHEDEEIRYVVDGTGYFDVRSSDDEWVRIELEKADLIILPAGIYHRFTTGQGNYIKAMRLFKSDPQWTPLHRSADVEKNPFRQEYLRSREGDDLVKA
ncbi:MAG: 1,2-dihydroxy-3-keto-5-methylthiopentene dioxygenase [Lichina confinis]|nr:MAG: 1,2-dihydroxy-3-keto-5-methylthiopentene dioxygenase [Lichina confinis]